MTADPIQSGSLLQIQSNVPQNPILIIKAPKVEL